MPMAYGVVWLFAMSQSIVAQVRESLLGFGPKCFICFTRQFPLFAFVNSLVHFFDCKRFGLLFLLLSVYRFWFVICRVNSQASFFKNWISNVVC